MKNHQFFAILWHMANALLIGAATLLLYGVTWTYSTGVYLRGFADAIVPLPGSAEDKSEALLNWLAYLPRRVDGVATGDRDPVEVLRDGRLLKFCGSATNAFVNLAQASGVKARRLLLLDESGNTMHVVAEVRMQQRWVVVDPSLGLVFKDRAGNMLTKEQLRDPEVFKDAISRMPSYNPGYAFHHSANIHLRRIPVFDRFVRWVLNGLSPNWETMANWGYLPEHPSLWPILMSLPLLICGILARAFLDSYGRQKLGISRVEFRKRLTNAARAFSV